MSKELLIFARGKWEITHQETTFGDKRQVWVRRDQSWICDVGQEEAIMPMPPKPKKRIAA